jgi:hypothetical protein
MISISTSVFLCFKLTLLLFCAVVAISLASPDADADAYGYRSGRYYNRRPSQYKRFRSYDSPFVYGGPHSPYGAHYSPDKYYERHYGVHKPALDSYRQDCQME